MQCPKCNAAMKHLRVGDVTVDQCSDCGGYWLDALEAERIKSAGTGASVDVARGNGGESVAAEGVPVHAPIACPGCGTRMILLMVDCKPPMYFEHCGRCRGVFLDAGELGRMHEVKMEEWLRATIPGVFKLRLPPEE